MRRNERALYHYNALTHKSGFPDVMRKMAKRPELVDKLAGEVSDYRHVTFQAHISTQFAQIAQCGC
jgi:hypothetical protein